ncbi:hypothetical protein [Flavobacterium foetidum]|uniref:hypothetical protein n=1 Tax=Flavobacterium foetidum TaxID=2026681 RepID=UPI0013C33416|nr:hypothetical protein [Flavobacterium foetidum]KAF2514899.1 hypothetical protein E0W73_10730 [Flavobacterium foetidum]
MKIRKEKKEVKKFDLDKMEVARLKNMRVITGGDGDDPIDTNHNKAGSSNRCQQND